MATGGSIPPLSPASLASIRLPDFQFLTARTANNAFAAPDIDSAPVALSARGQFLSSTSITAAAAELPEAVEPAVPATIPTQTPVAAMTVSAVNTGTVASDAMRALQRLLADPAVHARKTLFDPAYAGLVAASQLNTFVLRSPATEPKNLTQDFPEPITSVAPADAIAEYNEAAESPREQKQHRINRQV